MLTSLQNPRIKAVRSLHTKKGRQAAGDFLLETTKLVQEALRSGWPILEAYATDSWVERYGSLEGVKLERVADRLFPSLVTTETPEGIVAIAKLPQVFDLPPVRADSWFIATEAIQDPGNLGTLIRTADAVGASAVLLGPGTVDPYSPKVIRATMGSLFHLPVLLRPKVYEDVAQLRERGVSVYATTMQAERSLYDLDLKGPLLWLIGNEGQGLSVEALALATERVSIPMPGHAESLNAAIASAICLYETLRQRMKP